MNLLKTALWVSAFVLFAATATAQLVTQLTTNDLLFRENSSTKAFITWQSGTNVLEIVNQEVGDSDISLESRGDIFFRTGSPSVLNRMFIDQDGLVGIGTLSPDGQLDIETNSSPNDPHLMLTETGNGDFARISFRNTAAVGDDFWNLGGRATGASDDPRFQINYNNGSEGNIFFRINPNDDNTLVDSDIIPFDGNDLFDLGNNTAGEFWDDVVCNDLTELSDKTIKKDIQNLEYGLEELLQLRPVRYQHKTDLPQQRKRIGLIAQEVQQVIPELVKTHDVDRNKKGQLERKPVEILGMNYSKLSVVLINAIQEQQTLIEEKDQQIEDLEARIAKLEQLILPSHNTQTVELNAVPKTAYLKQNQPNPFSTTTTIDYNIPETVRQAEIIITDLNGAVLKKVVVEGQGQLEIAANSLSAGTYTYSLVMDGEIVATNKMVLTK